MDCRPPASSVQGILQARILEWVAISSSRGSSWPRDWMHVFRLLRLQHWQVGFLPLSSWEAPRVDEHHSIHRRPEQNNKMDEGRIYSLCLTELGWSPGRGNGNPLQYSCLENSVDGGVWWATVHEVAKSQAQPSANSKIKTARNLSTLKVFPSIQTSGQVIWKLGKNEKNFLKTDSELFLFIVDFSFSICASKRISIFLPDGLKGKERVS